MHEPVLRRENIPQPDSRCPAGEAERPALRHAGLKTMKSQKPEANNGERQPALSPATCCAADRETFDAAEVEKAIEQFIEWGEREYQKSQLGYFSGGGWAARCLRYHLEEIKSRRHNDGR